MKRAIDERGPIAAWLIRARAQFREPNAERTWTVADFLKELKADTGWAPTRTTYARWESGATRPEPENLRRVEAFYAKRGVAGLAAPTGATETPDLAAAVSALTDELAAMRLEREAWTRGVVGVLRAYAAGQVPEALLDALAPPPHVDVRP